MNTVTEKLQRDRIKMWQKATGLLPPEVREQASCNEEFACESVIDFGHQLMPLHSFGGKRKGGVRGAEDLSFHNIVKLYEDERGWWE